MQEIREWFDGPLALSGSIATGRAILAAQAMGADFAYIGSAFIATEEARAIEGYKQMIVESSSQDIVYSSLFTGVHGNYLRGSIVNAGMDPDKLPESDPSAMNFGGGRKAWKEIWGSGQGIGIVGGGGAGTRTGGAPARRVRRGPATAELRTPGSPGAPRHQLLLFETSLVKPSDTA